MTSADIDTLLLPVSPDDPCGPNLEYDASFAELDRAATIKPEQQIGNTIVPAEDPDWVQVEKLARALLARSKDLRAATHLVKAALRTDGWAGFAAGLGALRELLTRHWDGVHPRLDPEDDNDPTSRLNILAGLGDAATAAAVRTTALLSSRAVGRFSLREVEIASGDAPAPADGTAAASTATLDAVAAELDLASLVETADLTASCGRELAAIEAFVTEQVGAAQSLSVGRLPTLVKKAHAFLAERIARRAPSSGAPLEAAPATSAGVAGSASGEIASRQDVIRALDRIIAYYARYEPSSPIPMLIERSKRLVAMSFIDIIRDLVPDGVSQVEVLRGRTE